MYSVFYLRTDSQGRTTWRISFEAHGNMEFRKTESEKGVKKIANDIETSEFQEAFDGGLESLTIWLEGLPKLQRQKVLDLVEQSAL